MTITAADLKAELQAGLVADIFFADRAYALLRTIGLHAVTINASSKNFGELFGTIQAVAQIDALLSVARVYDRPDARYPTRCIDALLKLLEDNASALPRITDRQHVTESLVRLGMARPDTHGLTALCDEQLIRSITAFVRRRLGEPDIKDAVDQVKTVRDKRIAHNEAAHGLTGPTWAAVLRLLSFAKEFVGLIGWAFLSTVYTNDGRYRLTEDAERPSLAMERVLSTLELT